MQNPFLRPEEYFVDRSEVILKWQIFSTVVYFGYLISEKSMSKRSAGILVFRRRDGSPEVFLVHPGGPFWSKKDDGSWSIPKGLYQDNEDALVAAKREFLEETGFSPSGNLTKLGDFKQPSGKTISAWTVEDDLDPSKLVSNTFTLEWPPKSGSVKEFPEVDRASWFVLSEAMLKITKGQVSILEAFGKKLGVGVAEMKSISPNKFDSKGQGSLF